MESLDRPFIEKEISNAVFSLPKGKALGPDGYPSEFYQTFWDLIKSDICKFFNQFHASNTDISRLNYTFISLIPKKQECKTIRDFRPISLMNGVLKILFKVLCIRLS